jgi:hypothetical protein
LPPQLPFKNGSKNKLLDVNVSLGMLYFRGILLMDLFLQWSPPVPMKQEVPTSVHWQLIPFSVRQQFGHPPLYFDLASDMDDNAHIFFDHVFPRRPLAAKDLDKTACDVEQMIILCDDVAMNIQQFSESEYAKQYFSTLGRGSYSNGGSPSRR